MTTDNNTTSIRIARCPYVSSNFEQHHNDYCVLKQGEQPDGAYCAYTVAGLPRQT